MTHPPPTLAHDSMPPAKKARRKAPASNSPQLDGTALSKPKSSSPEEVPPDSLISTTASIEYWSSISADDNGMLGGYPTVSRTDIAGSRSFLAKLRRLHPSGSLPQPPAKLKLVVDCGAGIGRITTNFLVSIAEQVHVVEPIAKFTEHLKGQHAGLFEGSEPVISKVVNVGLEDFTPEDGAKYDLIWNQWCVGHLTDTVLTAYLRRLIAALSDGGFIIVKENLSTDAFGEDIYDKVDSSVTRSDGKFRKIFEDAGLKVVRSELQRGMEKLDLYPVRMYGLQPE